ncbi:MAG: hypothetical protein AAF191_20195 [Verrucomicrobiota bacterium]
MATAEERIRQVIDGWSLSEPLFFHTWLTHRCEESSQTRSIRVGRGLIEFAPDYIDSLADRELDLRLRFEVTRILLRHPYERKRERPELAYQASNLAIQECLGTSLSFPFAVDVFGSDEYDRQPFEVYYHLLHKRTPEASGDDSSPSSTPDPPADGEIPAPFDEAQQAALWELDLLQQEVIRDRILHAESTQAWGSIPGQAQETILANLRPKIDYRRVLREFRASILTMERRLTRMRPNRRYGFAHLGSRREFGTRLLIAIDVSGSVSSEDLGKAFSVLNQFFRFGIGAMEVLQFDAALQGDPIPWRKARREVRVLGRGGTLFQPVYDYLESQPSRYDGLILFTDGQAPLPLPLRRNRQLRVVWLLNQEENWKRIAPELKTHPRTRSAYLTSQ